MTGRSSGAPPDRIAGASLMPGSGGSVAPSELRADAARNRARILEVAGRQVVGGDLSLQMNAIARLAGVGVGTVYRHFPTRQALLEHLALGSFDVLVAEARAAWAEADAAKGLDRLLRRALDLMLSDPALAAVLSLPEFDCPQTLDLADELASSVGAVLDRAHAAGLIRSEITPDDIRRLLCGLRYGLESGRREPATIDLFFRVLLAGLRPDQCPER
jgi:AcrR family transcriptional regulator